MPGVENEQRDDHGRWTSGGSGTHAEKRTFMTTDHFRDDVKAIFGKDISPSQFADLAGAPNEEGIQVNMNSDGETVHLMVTSDDIFAVRQVTQGEDGLLLFNADFHLSSGTGNGVGTKAFVQQVKTARKMGIAKIVTQAAGSPGTNMNGYYTWARLGYDGELDAAQKKKAVEAGFQGVGTIHELFAKTGGREFWKEQGDLFEGTFDLSSGSLSRKVLKAYAESKGIDTTGI